MSNKIVTGKVRFSYVHVFEPTTSLSGNERYSISILVPKTDKETIKKISSAIEAAKKLGVEKFGSKFTGNIKEPIKDGDDSKDPNYHGHLYFTATSGIKFKVTPININREELDADSFYSGCYGKAQLTLLPYMQAGTKGISVYFNNLLKTDDGDRLGGSTSATSVFLDDLLI